MSILSEEHGSSTAFTLGAPAWIDADIPCQWHDAALWFAEAPEDVARAQRLCLGCPRRTECLVGALDRAEPWGVWGGEIFDQGVPVARRPRRGRPRKDDRDRRAAERALRKRLSGGIERRVSTTTTGAPPPDVRRVGGIGAEPSPATDESISDRTEPIIEHADRHSTKVFYTGHPRR